MAGVDVFVRFRVRVVEGPRPSLEGSSGQAEPQAVADADPYLGIERQKSHPDRTGLLLIHSSAFSDGAVPNPPAALSQQRPFLIYATAFFYLGYPWE